MPDAPNHRSFLDLRIKLLIGYTLLFSLAFGAAVYAVVCLETQAMLQWMSAEAVAAVQQQMVRSSLLVFVVVYSLGALLVYWLAGLFSRPLLHLEGLARQVSEGHYNLDFSEFNAGSASGEIDKLAQVFQVMVDKVYQRERALAEQVEALKIEVDEARAQKVVKEITETEFFQGLQTWAQEMRARRKRSDQ